MGLTPDRRPGDLLESKIVLQTTDDFGDPVVDPTELGGITYHDRMFAFKDADGVFNPRVGGDTTSAVTLSVNTSSGSDTPSANRPAFITGGDYSSYPFATIQAALNSLPKRHKHAVTINIASGNYAGFSVQGFLAAIAGADFGGVTLTINGGRSLSTLATGSNTGTITTGGSRTVTVTGAGWTANDLVGRYLYITSGTGSGQILVIAQNTSDTISLTAPASPAIGNGAGFNIEDPNVIVNSAQSNGVGIYAEGNTAGFLINDVKVTSCTYQVAFINNPGSARLTRVVASGGTYGIFAQQCAYVAYNQCAALGSTYGFYLLHSINVSSGTRGWLASNCGSYGIVLINILCTGSSIVGIWIRGSSTYGLMVRNAVLISVSDLYIDSAATGLYSTYGSLELIAASINNCTVAPFELFHPSKLLLRTSLAGTGNTGWGLNASGVDNIVNLYDFTPTITGASGAVTVDGTNDVTWANLGSAGDYAFHVGTGCRISRR